MTTFLLMNNKKKQSKIIVDKVIDSGVAFACLLNTGICGNHTRKHCGIFMSGSQKGCRDGQGIYRILAAASYTLCSTSRHFAESIEQEYTK